MAYATFSTRFDPAYFMRVTTMTAASSFEGQLAAQVTRFSFPSHPPAMDIVVRLPSFVRI
jgi:hypothetical protein